MDWINLFDREKFILFTLILTRLSGMIMIAPFFSNRNVPMQYRALFTFALAMLVAPVHWHIALAAPETTLDYLIVIGSEFFVGLILGLGMMIFFSGIQLGGLLVGRIGGMMIAASLDPQLGEQVPIFGRFYSLVATAIFVCIGGHRLLMAALLETFNTIPVGGAGMPVGATESLMTVLQQSFELGVRATFPVITALLLSTFVLGLIGRAVPQINILIVGFGLNAMLTYAMVALTIGTAVFVFEEQIASTITTLMPHL